MTGWEHAERLIAVWGLQSFSVQYVHFEERADRQGGSRTVKVVGLEDRRGHHICPQCGQQHAWGVQQETEPRRWRDCSLGDVETYVEILPWRVACCGGTCVECFPWEATGHRMTKRFFERTAALCTRLPISEVAEMMHLSWDTVCRVDKEAIQFAIGDRSELLEGLRWIGVDEVSRTGGHVYFTIVTDLERGRVVWIGDGTGEAALNAFFDLLGKKRCRKIKGVVSDLAKGYLLAIATRIPQALHVLDRFHIVKWLNEALNDVRRRLFGQAPTDDLGRTLKGKKWLLLSAYERLEPRQRRLLWTLMKLNRPLYRCYLLKERLRGLLHHGWAYLGALRRNLTAWCRAAIHSRLEPMKVVGRRLRAHIDKVLAAYRAPVLMGYVESMNGNIVVLRREARGYRDPDYYKLKIYQRCSLPDNPWAKIVL